MKCFIYTGNSNTSPDYVDIWKTVFGSLWGKIIFNILKPELACNRCKIKIKNTKTWWGVIDDKVYCRECYESHKKTKHKI